MSVGPFSGFDKTIINVLGSKDAIKKFHLACKEIIDDN
jgi:hypothetical protein